MDPTPYLEIPDNFRWRTDKGHLAFKHHIPNEQLITHARHITKIKLIGSSVVHETKDGYPHTH